MKKLTKLNLTLLLAFVLAIATACSNDKQETDDSATAPIKTAEQETEEEATDETEQEDGAETADEPTLQESDPKESDLEVVEEMKAEENVEDAIAIVTDDGYVLTTFTAEEGMDKAAAESLAKEYGEKLAKKYPDHIIDIEVMHGEDFLAVLTINPEDE